MSLTHIFILAILLMYSHVTFLSFVFLSLFLRVDYSPAVAKQTEEEEKKIKQNAKRRERYEKSRNVNKTNLTVKFTPVASTTVPAAVVTPSHASSNEIIDLISDEKKKDDHILGATISPPQCNCSYKNSVSLTKAHDGTCPLYTGLITQRYTSSATIKTRCNCGKEYNHTNDLKCPSCTKFNPMTLPMSEIPKTSGITATAIIASTTTIDDNYITDQEMANFDLSQAIRDAAATPRTTTPPVIKESHKQSKKKDNINPKTTIQPSPINPIISKANNVNRTPVNDFAPTVASDYSSKKQQGWENKKNDKINDEIKKAEQSIHAAMKTQLNYITYIVGLQMLDDSLGEKYITKKGDLLKKLGPAYIYNRDAVHIENA